jgi:hypothetical protein
MGGKLLWAMFKPLLALPLGWCHASLDTAIFLQNGKSNAKANQNTLLSKFRSFKKHHRQVFVVFPEGTIMKKYEQDLSQKVISLYYTYAFF